MNRAKGGGKVFVTVFIDRPPNQLQSFILLKLGLNRLIPDFQDCTTKLAFLPIETEVEWIKSRLNH